MPDAITGETRLKNRMQLLPGRSSFQMPSQSTTVLSSHLDKPDKSSTILSGPSGHFMLTRASAAQS